MLPGMVAYIYFLIYFYLAGFDSTLILALVSLNWRLLTPPHTPLFTSLDDETPPVNLAQRGRPRSQHISISRSSTVSWIQFRRIWSNLWIWRANALNMNVYICLNINAFVRFLSPLPMFGSFKIIEFSQLIFLGCLVVVNCFLIYTIRTIEFRNSPVVESLEFVWVICSWLMDFVCCLFVYVFIVIL